MNSAFIDSKNRAWWGGGKGLEMLDLKKFILSDLTPQPVLKQLDINEQFIDYRNISDSLGNEIEFNGVQKFQNYPLNLELPYDKNHLTFHFVAFDWAAPHKIQYSYLMKGLNTNWSQPSHEAKADYRNLPYGNYTFKVRAIGASGEWSEAFEYTFTIHPPWWHTWWARTLYALFALVLILGFVRWRTSKLQQRQKELETEVDKATKEIRHQKEEVEKQKEVLEEAHKEIRDSINYAKRIQSAILPPQKLVKEYLPKHFIFYRPKDIVSGDFYYIEMYRQKVFIGIADCTGHGVPGAMMTSIGAAALNNAILDRKISNPAKILYHVDGYLKSSLSTTKEGLNDGMDIGLIVLNIANSEIEYCGAKRPLIIVDKEKNISVVPGTKRSIGQFIMGDEFNFKTTTISVSDSMSIYCFSDGIPDQFGGSNEKKIYQTNLNNLLAENSSLPMKEQAQKLEEFVDDWQGNTDQTDDMVLFGAKLTTKYFEKLKRVLASQG